MTQDRFMLANCIDQGFKLVGVTIASIVIFPPIAHADNVFATNPEMNTVSFVSTTGSTGSAIALTNNQSF